MNVDMLGVQVAIGIVEALTMTGKGEREHICQKNRKAAEGLLTGLADAKETLCAFIDEQEEILRIALESTRNEPHKN